MAEKLPRMTDSPGGGAVPSGSFFRRERREGTQAELGSKLLTANDLQPPAWLPPRGKRAGSPFFLFLRPSSAIMHPSEKH